jgi:hypothetical protein
MDGAKRKGRSGVTGGENNSVSVLKCHDWMRRHADIFSCFQITILLFKPWKTFPCLMSIQYHMIQSELTFDLAFWKTWFSISMLFLLVGIPDVRMASSLKNNQFADL